jgi:hypothetical protein
MHVLSGGEGETTDFTPLSGVPISSDELAGIPFRLLMSVWIAWPMSLHSDRFPHPHLRYSDGLHHQRYSACYAQLKLEA